MSEYAELIKKRGTLKGRLTNFEKYVGGFAEVDKCNEVQSVELKFRLDKIMEVFSDFDQIQTAIEIEIDDDDDELRLQQSQRLDFETQYFRTIARAEVLIRSFKSKPGSTSSKHSDHEGDDTDTVRENTDGKGVKLPTIYIPKFSGDLGNWLEFRDTYVSLIHNNTSITSIQKFHYLRASLEGSAMNVIRSLQFSASNYTVAWSLLCERYDNTRLLIQNHVKAIFNEEPIKKESAFSIRKLLDAYTKNLRSLQILGENVGQWDTLIIYIMSSKLDAQTFREWEELRLKHDRLNFLAFCDFLRNRADLLETIDSDSNEQDNVKQPSKHVRNKNLRALTASAQDDSDMLTLNAHVQPRKVHKCPLCYGEHLLYTCSNFANMDMSEREKFVQASKVCVNCLRAGHHKRTCRLGPCKICKKRHNSLLHRDTAESTSNTAIALSVNKRCGNVLLATALIKIRDVRNREHEVRAVLDSGSQASFMTQSLMSKLGLPSTQTTVSIAGVNNTVSVVNKQCNTKIQSRLNEFEANVTFLVVPQVSSTNQTVDVSTLNIPSSITLADPEFFNPSSLDLLLGADIFWDVLCTRQVRLNNKYPVLQETKFGYIVSGPTGQGNSNTSSLSCNLVSQFDAIQEQLAKFWAMEELPDAPKSIYSNEEKLCEQHFTQNMKRAGDGRFIVAIPLKMSEAELGDSFVRAQHCFLSLERRFQKQPLLKAMYVDFMKEYENLGHMTKGNISKPHNNSYFLPHHGVLREQSSTTKLRAVFNASAPTSTGLSLNDIQMVGPTIQSDLLTILLRFRQHRFAMAGDIEKMYRQVLIQENQRHLQQIIWRDDPSQPLDVYTLNTVTYGTASAPFLAVRCLKQLANECDNEQIRQIINDDFYVDDLLTGASTAEGLMQIRSQVSKVLASGCFNLRKFRSNLPACNNRDSSNSSVVVDLSEHTQCNTLGLKWSPSEDQLHFVIKDSQEAKVTKRVILSTISQVFDPLGVLSLFLITGKILLQKLWLHKLQWDDPLPRDVLSLWTKFAAGLTRLQELRISRYVMCNDPVDVQLHTFCDASKDAYGACSYIRSTDPTGEVTVNLLCAKSRVAPLKATTIPRLELCGAATAAKLVDKILSTTRLHISKCVLWTDSSVVLGWLRTPPNRLKQFVKNRVSNIQEMTQTHTWRHVPTAKNPADLLSRGITVSQMDDLDIWWHGPEFLADTEDNWPNKIPLDTETLPEVTVNIAVKEDSTELFPFIRFSKLNKLINCMVYVLRFIEICKKRVSFKDLGPITHSERQSAYNKLLKLSQIESFPDEYDALNRREPLSHKNKLLSLSPFMDNDGLIRVGGRIMKGDFSFQKKHPILLTSKHPLAKLIFEQEHIRLMHAAPQSLLSAVRDQIWPLGGRSLARKVVHKCLRCFRFNAKLVNPIMGNLPAQRLNPGYPFQTTAMDYAGPMTALNRRGRGSKTTKVYIALFVCFTTKAIHLELVSDLTKDSFLSALRRFIARRSKPKILYSDNGTQFVGARNELSTFIKNNEQTIGEATALEGIDFKFIPSYTPHMAGLAEAGVKSVKMHLRRVLGNAHLVFEDLYTVLVQIEAILNSRPLSPLSSDPNDLSPLTPGHFLVGRPLTALPVPTLVDANAHRLTRFERMEQIRQQFWIRWQKEYVAELQQRTKWRTSKGQLKEGTLVLIKEDSSPPMMWSMGRVTKVYPGTDGISRVADLKTSRGVVRRAFNRICPLPIDDDTGVERQAFQRRGAC